MSPRWLRDEEEPGSWERGQEQRLDNMLAAFVVTLGERVQTRMARAAGCSPTAVAALQWVDRGRRVRTCDLAEALEITMSGASQLVRSLAGEGLVQRTRHPHDRRQWRLRLTQLGERRRHQAVRARADLVRELVTALPFPWRVRLIRILERLLAHMADSRRSVLQICRHCAWDCCRDTRVEPCPVALAYAQRTTSSRPR